MRSVIDRSFPTSPSEARSGEGPDVLLSAQKRTDPSETGKAPRRSRRPRTGPRGGNSCRSTPEVPGGDRPLDDATGAASPPSTAAGVPPAPGEDGERSSRNTGPGNSP